MNPSYLLLLSLLPFTAFAGEPFFKCTLPPLNIEVYADKGLYEPQKIHVWRQRVFDEFTIENVQWKSGGTGSCQHFSWSFAHKTDLYRIEELGCTGGDYPAPENAIGQITINDQWFWCY